MYRLKTARQLYRGQVLGIRSGEVGHWPPSLAGYAQRLAASRKDLQIGAGAQQRISERGTTLHQMLAVVQNQERLLRLQVPYEHRGQGAPQHLAHAQRRAQCGGYCLRQEIRVRERGQLHPPHPVLKAIHYLEGHRQREARLPAPSRTTQRKKAVFVFHKQTLDLDGLPLAAYEACKL